MIHTLKIWPEPFELIRLGVKTAEVRQGGGRSFRAGDVLRLEEWQTGVGHTGRFLTAQVTDCLLCGATPGEWGLQSGGSIVVMSLRLLTTGGKLSEAPTDRDRSGFCSQCGGKRWCPRCER